MSLLELCGLVFTYNAMTFGNGPAMVPLLQGGLVERRGVRGCCTPSPSPGSPRPGQHLRRRGRLPA